MNLRFWKSEPEKRESQPYTDAIVRSIQAQAAGRTIGGSVGESAALETCLRACIQPGIQPCDDFRQQSHVSRLKCWR